MLIGPPKKDKPAETKPTDIKKSTDTATKTKSHSSNTQVSKSNVLPSSSRSSEIIPAASGSSPQSQGSAASTSKLTERSSVFTESSIATPSSISSTSASDNNSACGLSKRAKPKKSPPGVEGVVGEDERSTECGKNGKTVHVTKTAVPIGSYLSVLPQKCPIKYPQACYHYR